MGFRAPKKHPARVWWTCEHLGYSLWPKHLLFFAGFGLKFQSAEGPFHSLGQVNGVPLEPPLCTDGPALGAPPGLAGCCVPRDVLGAPSGRPEDPVGVQTMLPGAGGHWKRGAGPRERRTQHGRRGEQTVPEGATRAEHSQSIHT